MKLKKNIGLTLAMVVLPMVVLLLLALTACTKRPVNPDAVAAQRQAEAQKVVHDFTTTVITLNHEGKLSDALEITLLRINQQVSDVIRDKPTNWLDGARTAVKNSVEALPPATQTQVRTFLDSLLVKLASVLNGGSDDGL